MNVRRLLGIGTLTLIVALCGAPQYAECAGQAPARPAGAVQAAPPARVPQRVDARVAAQSPAAALDADAVRAELEEQLTRYSPNVGRILALDPLLLQNASYLEPYPELSAFLGQHPEVVRNPSFYLARFRPDYYTPPDRDTRMIDAWKDMFVGLFVFMGFCIVTGALAWLVKTVVDYRRWYRLSKVQTDAHNKLLDRLTANEELLAYVNTPSGKRFLESAPIALDPTASMGSPLKRILWAIEIGLVLVCVAGGMLAARFQVPTELYQPFSVAGMIVFALGVGFVVAAVASYVISRRMGVLPPVAGSRTADAPPSA